MTHCLCQGPARQRTARARARARPPPCHARRQAEQVGLGLNSGFGDPEFQKRVPVGQAPLRAPLRLAPAWWPCRTHPSGRHTLLRPFRAPRVWPLGWARGAPWPLPRAAAWRQQLRAWTSLQPRQAVGRWAGAPALRAAAAAAPARSPPTQCWGPVTQAALAAAAPKARSIRISQSWQPG